MSAPQSFPLLPARAPRRGPVAPPQVSDRLLRALNTRPGDDATAMQQSARIWGLRTVDPLSPLPDPRLIDRLGALTCLRDGVVPLSSAGGTTVVATSRPEDFARLRPRLQAALGPVSMALAAAPAIEMALYRRRGTELARAAEHRVPAAESCRNLTATAIAPVAALALMVVLAGLWFAPLASGMIALTVAVVALAATLVLKLAALILALRAPISSAAPLVLTRLPTVSVIVALYRESDIAGRLVGRLSRLDYPQDKLDVLLAVEEEDRMTRDALARATLPPWMRVIVVPPGRVKTKPRALNFALDHCRGSIVGVYDAEDAPEPDQLRKVVAHFAARGPEVACLQGRLDYYNPTTNWLARCFTIEYATWFRLILPGLSRMGLPVPLGGTTLFFRREALERLGGWDAHNVTEDADLGMRLCRHGLRTELVDTTTHEEANCRALPWVKQRSRWIKGYMMTWAVHMRSPRLLWRQLGPRGFAGFQVLILGSVLQGLLAPLLWSFWAGPLGLPHPLIAAMPSGLVWSVAGLFAATEAVGLICAVVALRRSGHRIPALWVFTLPLYFPMATASAYKALWEMAVKPFYWDKTSHGHFDLPATPGAAQG